MAYITLPSPLLVPKAFPGQDFWTASPYTDKTVTFDSLNDACHQVGYVQWADKSYTPKTISSIHLVTGTLTSPVMTWTVGLQDPTNGATNHAGDGTFDRSTTVDVSGLTSDTAFEVTGFTGTKDLAHGDLISVTVQATSFTSGTAELLLTDAPTSFQNPTVYLNTTPQSACPNVLLEASDGTLGTLLNGGYITSMGGEVAYADTYEVGIIFSLPFNCKVAGAVVRQRVSSSSTVTKTYLYSSPTGGSPAAMTGTPVTYSTKDFYAGSTVRPFYHLFGADVTLAKDTDYALTFSNETGSAANLYVEEFSVDAAAEWEAMVGYESNGSTVCTYGHVTRQNSTGAFTTDYTKGVMCYLLVSEIDDGSGGSGGMVVHPGMSGGLRG